MPLFGFRLVCTSILYRSKNFHGFPPLLNFQNFEVAFLNIRLTQDAETLHANSRGQGRESAVGFKRIRNEKDFSTLLYGMFFLVKSDMSLEIHCCETVHSSPKRFSDLKCTRNLSIYLSIYLSTYLPSYLSTYLPIYLIIYISIS